MTGLCNYDQMFTSLEIPCNSFSLSVNYRQPGVALRYEDIRDFYPVKTRWSVTRLVNLLWSSVHRVTLIPVKGENDAEQVEKYGPWYQRSKTLFTFPRAASATALRRSQCLRDWTARTTDAGRVPTDRSRKVGEGTTLLLKITFTVRTTLFNTLQQPTCRICTCWRDITNPFDGVQDLEHKLIYRLSDRTIGLV